MKSMGRAVRDARESLGLTQVEVAEHLGITPQFYGRIERGNAFPGIATLVRMIHVLDVSADMLMGSGRRGRGRRARRAEWRTCARADSLELRRLVRRLRSASADTLKLISTLMEGLDVPEDEDEARDEDE